MSHIKFGAPPSCGSLIYSLHPPSSGAQSSSSSPRRLEDRLPFITSPSLHYALNLLTMHHRTAGLAVKDEEVDLFLGQITHSLVIATSEEIDRISPVDWILTAGIIRMTAQMVEARNNPSSVHGAHLVRAAGNLSSHVDDHFAEQTASDLLFQDHLLIQVLERFMEKPVQEDPRQSEALAAIFCRFGLLSVSLHWPAAGFELPNVIGGAILLYNGIDYEEVRKIFFYSPSHYFLAASGRRPEPIGSIERLLVTCLGGPADQEVSWRDIKESEKISKNHPENATLRRMNDQVFEAKQTMKPRQELLEELIQTASPTLFSSQGRHATLPSFLRRALGLGGSH